MAFSNEESKSIVIPARLKRKWFTLFGQRKKSKRESYLLLFSVGLFLLLKNHVKKDMQIVIDREYKGQEANLKTMHLKHFRGVGIKVGKDQIQFAQIGKKSKAHKLALSVFRERDKADRVTGEKELFRFVK